MEKFTDSLPEFFYDLIGIFIPGFFLYFCFSLIYPDSVSLLLQISFFNNTVSAILLIYIAGHIMYAFSNLIMPNLFNLLFGDPINILLGEKPKTLSRFIDKSIVGAVKDEGGFYKENIEKWIREVTKKNTFSLTKTDGKTADVDNIRVAWEFCRNFVMEHSAKRAGIIRKEQAYGEMARGILMVLLVSIPCIILKQEFGEQVEKFSLKMTIFAVSFLGFFYRYYQARRINPNFVYATFCGIMNTEHKVIK